MAHIYVAGAISQDSIMVYRHWFDSQYKNTIFVHCYSNNKLNLILKLSVDRVKECKMIFIKISELSSFLFFKSTKGIDTPESWNQTDFCQSPPIQ